ncbi:ATPase, T2SS/T4P/T4SS family [Pseudomonas sp. UMAB-40]|uniref:ATPase, T2SS/T4P/T4SS family n=1 Tax=Pseudomonas sp. UMAB-40 TaxID=1365407 RepID=UPI001C5895B9|nr:ATPase, T2SS/T4P/T4SS family [Pseudomonas sp. UMAB-40]
MTTFRALLGGNENTTEVIFDQKSSNGNHEYTSIEQLYAALPARIQKLRPDIVGEQNSSKFCPALMENGNWLILTTPDYERSDLLETARETCSGLHELGHPPVTHIVSPTLLLTLRQTGLGLGSVTTKEEASSYKAAFKEIVAWGIKNKASDVTLNVSESEAQSQVHFTIDGQYLAPPRWKIATQRLREILNVAWQSNTGGAGAILSDKIETQCRLQLQLDSGPVMCRWSGMAADRYSSVTLRLLKVDEKSVQKPLSELGWLPSTVDVFERALRKEGGSIIFAGVVNSGKTVSIASLLSLLPDTRKIISLEDPVELIIPGVIQNTITRSLEELGKDPFIAKNLTLKRSAANDVYLGEIRDLLTGTSFTDITGSGTKLYSTVHATSAMQIPERLYSESIGIPSDFLSSPGMLNVLAYQALIPKLCPHCSLPSEHLELEGGFDKMERHRDGDYWKVFFNRIDKLYSIDTGLLKVRNPQGCKYCKNPELPMLGGYIGRDTATELIEPGTDRTFLRYVKARDMLGLQDYLDDLPRTAFDDPDMTNKTIVECAVYKSLQGTFDPRDIESKTTSFESIAMTRKKAK